MSDEEKNNYQKMDEQFPKTDKDNNWEENHNSNVSEQQEREYAEEERKETSDQESNSEEVGNETYEASTKAVKQTAESAVGGAKLLFKLIKNAFKINVILGIVVLLIVFALVLVKTYFPEFSISDSSVSETDVQAAHNIASSEIMDSNYQDYAAKMKEILERYNVTEEIEEYYKFKKETNHVNIIGNIVSDTSNSIDMYNKNSGYQILNQEAILLLFIERLSYAFSELEWKPNYGAIEAEDTLYKEYNRISKVLNNNFKSKIAASMVGNNSPYVFTTGENLPDDVVSYYKEPSGIDKTTEIKEKVSFFHKILERNRKYEITIQDSSLECPELKAWFANPELRDSNKIADTVNYKNLQEIEEPYKLSYELMHHETTLQVALDDISKNSIFNNVDAKSVLEKTISRFMPMFEYATYNDSIAKKTFFDYELYNGTSFDEKGEYILPDTFKTKFYGLTKNKAYDIDYSLVEKVRMLEKQLRNIDILLDTNYSTETYEREMKEKERADILNLLQYEEGEYEKLVKYEKANNLQKEYIKRSEELEKILLNFGNDASRPYDPKNHNVFKDSSYYIDRYSFYNASNTRVESEYVNSYDENVTVTATGKYTADGDVNIDAATLDAEAELSVTSKIEATNKQNSLLPLRFQSMFVSMEYDYNKEESFDSDLYNRVKESYRNASWSKTVEEQGGKTVSVFTKEASTYGFNSGVVTVTTKPGTKNEEGQLAIDEDLKEYYGKTEENKNEEMSKAKQSLSLGFKITIPEE